MEQTVFNTTPVRLIDVEVVDKIITIGIGPEGDSLKRAKFRNCTFEFKTGLMFIASSCEFFGCTFRPLKKMECGIFDNYWEDCTFIGKFVGTHFGVVNRSDDSETPWPDIAVRSCDFSKAIMSGCRLFRLDINSTSLPVWPCFSILEPHKNHLAWKAAKLPFSTRFGLDSSDSCSAIMYHWPSVAKWYKLDPAIDPEEVRGVLSSLDFVRL